MPIYDTEDKFCLPGALLEARINNLANEVPNPDLNYKTSDMSSWEYIMCVQNGLVAAVTQGGYPSFPKSFPFAMRHSPCWRCLSTEHKICESEVTEPAEWFRKGFLEMKSALRNSNTTKPPETYSWVKAWKKPVTLTTPSSRGDATGNEGGRGRGKGRGGRGKGRGKGQHSTTTQQNNSLSTKQPAEWSHKKKASPIQKVRFADRVETNYP